LGFGAGRCARSGIFSFQRLGARSGWPARSVVQFPGWARIRVIKIIPLFTNMHVSPVLAGAPSSAGHDRIAS